MKNGVVAVLVVVGLLMAGVAATAAPPVPAQKSTLVKPTPTPTPKAHMIEVSKLRMLKLPPPNPQLTLVQGVAVALRPQQVKKEISCGIFVYPPPNPPNPNVMGSRLFFVNNTTTTLPVGTVIEYKVYGTAPCCHGFMNPLPWTMPPNPPSQFYAVSGNPVVAPPQQWTRACEAWAILP